MRLLDLHIDGFGKFHNTDLSFSDGLNVIYGKNEAGKSTLHTFIRCMLFGLERARGRASKTDTWSRFEPWDNRAVYGGRLRVEQNGTVYRLERVFSKERKSFTIVDETNGKEVEPTRAFLDGLLCGLSETGYVNTISIGQLKSATDNGMVSELRNYIANMNTSGSMALNITKATDNLKNRRRQFERQLKPDAAKDYASLTAEIRDLEQEISDPKYENQLLTWQKLRSQVQSELGSRQEERETLLQRVAAGKQALAGAQFTDEASIRKYLEDTGHTYREYQELRAASEKKSSSVRATVFLILTIAMAAGAAFCYGAGDTNPLARLLHASPSLVFCGFSIGAIACACITGAILRAARGLKKDLETNGKLLQEVFSRHLGDSAVSDSAMQAFTARMEEFIRLSQTLVKSEAALKEQSSAISGLHEKAASCDASISAQQKTQWELEKKLDHLASCKDRMESLQTALEENNRLRSEIDAIDLAIDTMTGLSETIRDSFGLYLNKAASGMIAQITGGIYTSMSVDENLNVFMNTPAKLVPLAQVSSGTMDQIYLALRLASARLLQKGPDKMPLIFDDSFVLYDDERLRSALQWLSKAFGGQILIFTCHRREARMLDTSRIPYHLVDIETAITE